MEYMTLNNGLRMPVLGLGTYQLHGKECERSVLDAIDLGYRLFDTAQMYGNEKELGNAIRQSRVPREELFITTKIYRPDTNYKRAKDAIEASLRVMQLDYIDLLLIHEPYREGSDMYRALEEAYRDGKLKAIGISNYNINQYNSFINSCSIIPAVNQVEAHVFFQQHGIQNAMQKHGTCMEAWSPFAAGKKNIFENAILNKIGVQYGKSAAQVALKYLIQRGIAAVPKSGHRDRLAGNMDIFDFRLSDDDMKKIKALDGGRTLFGWY